MNFLNPWAIGLAAAAVALPLVVHWLTRPRPIVLPLSTIRFVRQAIRQRRARYRLRDALVLGLRALAILLLGWALARPFWGSTAAIVEDDSAKTARVVVLDVSQSMAAISHGVEVFERARARTAQHLPFRANLRANLILAGAKPTAIFDRPSLNVTALREQVAEAEVVPQRLDVVRALQAASEMLAAVADENTRLELVVVSDFQRTNWATADFSVLPQETQIQLESVASTAPANMAVVDVRHQGRPTDDRDVQLEIELANFSPTARKAIVEVAAGNSTYRTETICPPNEKTILSPELAFDGGWRSGSVRLLEIDDDLASDNSLPFALEVRRAPTYAIVTREPEAKRPSASFYLERALVPFANRQDASQAQVIRVTPEQAELENLGAVGLIVINHPGKLTGEAIGLLASLLRRGRPVLYVASELVDATNMKLLVQAAGSSLQPPVELIPPPRGGLRRDLFLVEMRSDAPPFNIFGDQLSAAIAPLRFSGGLATQRVEGTLDDDVLATYSDRSVCMYVTSAGAGALAVLNANLNTSNFAVSDAFVPMLGELVQHLLSRDLRDGAARCGEVVVQRLPASNAPINELTLVAENSTDQPLGQITQENDGLVWTWPTAGPPGVYHVKQHEQTVYSLAVTTPPEESDLRTIDQELLTGRLAGERHVHFRSTAGNSPENQNNWSWFAVACVLCMLGEILALQSFKT